MLRVNTEFDQLPCIKRNTSGTATTLMAVELVSKRVVRFTTLGITNALLNYGRAINVILYRTSTRRISCCTSRYANGGIGGY